jgi:uncharacterized protein YecE (DUF72 family)
VNNTFYRLPDKETFAAWREALPRGFIAAIKASRFLTHMKKLVDPEEPIARLFDRAAALGPRLGPVLYQLPAALPRDLPRLARFLAALPAHVRLPHEATRRPVRHAVEFRHPSWYAAEVFDLLADANVALCLHDRTGSAIAGRVVGPFVYVRYHGSTGDYRGSYSRPEIDRQADWLAGQYASGFDVYAYFNNDAGGAAPANALALRAAIGRRAALRA